MVWEDMSVQDGKDRERPVDLMMSYVCRENVLCGSLLEGSPYFNPSIQQGFGGGRRALREAHPVGSSNCTGQRGVWVIVSMACKGRKALFCHKDHVHYRIIDVYIYIYVNVPQCKSKIDLHPAKMKIRNVFTYKLRAESKGPEPFHGVSSNACLDEVYGALGIKNQNHLFSPSPTLDSVDQSSLRLPSGRAAPLTQEREREGW